MTIREKAQLLISHGLDENSKDSLRRIVRMELARRRKFHPREITKMKKAAALTLMLIVSIPAFAFDHILPAHNLLYADEKADLNSGQTVQSLNDTYQSAVTVGETSEGRSEKPPLTVILKFPKPKRVEVSLGIGSLLGGNTCNVPIASITNLGFYVVRDIVQIEANVARRGNLSAYVPLFESWRRGKSRIDR